MAVRLDSGDSLARSASLPTSFTILCHAIRDGAGGGSQNLLGVDDNTVGAPDYLIYLVWDEPSGDLVIVTGDVGAGGFPVDSVATLGTGTSFAAAITRNFLTGETTGYYRAHSANTWSTAAHTRITTTATGVLWVGNDVYGEYWDGRIWGVKCWDRVLTAAELLNESYYRRVLYPSSINFHWPLDNAADVNDYSGNARNPTVAGTLASADGSFGLWRPRRRIFIPSSAVVIDMVAAGTLSVTGAADLDATGTLAAAGALSITGAADLDARGTLTAAGALSITGSAADLDALGSLTAAGSLVINGLADLDALGNLVAAGTVVITGAADLTGASANDMSAAGALSITGSADLDAIGQLAAAGSLIVVGAADLTAPFNDMAAAGSLAIIGFANLTGPQLAAEFIGGHYWPQKTKKPRDYRAEQDERRLGEQRHLRELIERAAGLIEEAAEIAPTAQVTALKRDLSHLSAQVSEPLDDAPVFDAAAMQARVDRVITLATDELIVRIADLLTDLIQEISEDE